MKNAEKLKLMNIGMVILGVVWAVFFMYGCFTTGTSAPVVAMWLLLALLLLHWSKQVFRTHCWLRRMRHLMAGTPREQQALRRNIFWYHAYGFFVILCCLGLLPMVEKGDPMAEPNMMVFTIMLLLFYACYRVGIKNATASLRAVCRRQK